MKKSVIALVITGSLALAGCSSSGSAGSSNGDNVVDRPQPQVPVIPDIDNSPEWGLDTGNNPDRPEPVDPDFGLPTPSIPDIDNTPDWGLDTGNTPDRNPPMWSGPDNSGNTPDRLPPVWGGPEMPPIDNGPEASYTISGKTITDQNGNVYEIQSVNWHGQAMVVTDNDGNVYEVQIERQGIYEGDFTVFFNGQAITIGRDTVQGGPRPLMEGSDSSIDRNSIRDAVRARLNK
ncbi:hypothetical protein OH458_16275 [Vibrio sp. MarTm2]|uniref:hypothetical protein n=1 Tax=Vibrio sp. MarTm2 TaxID=2998831 RepID=UPI0022CD73C6|nr:hypothetical protein [Vibrio sp. MarTm2]MDA0129626.1 hypothetical protein [Vibrio sp. MarTm2]